MRIPLSNAFLRVPHECGYNFDWNSLASGSGTVGVPAAMWGKSFYWSPVLFRKPFIQTIKKSVVFAAEGVFDYKPENCEYAKKEPVIKGVYRLLELCKLC